MRLQGKVAIVTGAGRGIGRAYALGLAGEGAKVAIAELHRDAGQAVAAEIKDKGGEAIAVRTDVSDEQSTLEMAKATAEAFGGIDIIVNNAAAFADDATGFNPLMWDPLQGPMDHWRKIMAVNADGILLCIRAVVPYMKQRGGGKIINQSSTGAFSSYGPYGISKWSVIEITRWMSGILGPFKINVNAIAPGIMRTEAVVSREHRTTEQTQAYLDQMKAMNPWGRIGDPNDLVGPMLFLASSESDYVNGQCLSVDGGASKRP